MKILKIHAALYALCAAAALLASIGAHAKEPLEKTKVSLAVGGKTALYYLPLTIAEQLGYFKDEGLNVTVNDFAGGGKALQAVVGGSADVGAGGFEHMILMQSKGQAFQEFALMGRTAQLVFAAKSDKGSAAPTIASLKGKKVGISAPGSSTQMLVNLVLQKAGMKPSDVSYIGIGTTASVVSAVRNGQVDAVSNADPMITMLQQSGDIKIIADTRTIQGSQAVFSGNMPSGSLYAPVDFIKKYPNTVQALTNAIVRANKWLQTAKPNDLIKVVPESYLLNDQALYLSAFHNLREAYSPDGVMPEDGPKTALRALTSFVPELKPEQIRLEETYTNHFAQKANEIYK